MNSAIAKLEHFLSQDGNVVFAVLFGSGAKGKQKPGSDIDIAVYFKNPPEGLAYLDLVNLLSDLAGSEVDLIVLNSASAFLRHQVMKTKVNVVVKDPIAYCRFREKTMSDYDEYKYVSGIPVYD